MRAVVFVFACVSIGASCTPSADQGTVVKQSSSGGSIAWSSSIPCAVAVVGGESAHVETICCAPKPSASSEWACTVSGAPPAKASPSVSSSH